MEKSIFSLFQVLITLRNIAQERDLCFFYSLIVVSLPDLTNLLLLLGLKL